MTQVQENNRLIAEFCGWTIEPGMEKEENPYYNQPYKPGFIPQMILLSDMQFHKSWDLLMPACRKFDKLNLLNKEYEGLCDEIDNAVSCYEIKAAFNNLSNAIKWFNSNK